MTRAREILRFLRRHWAHAVALPVMALLVTVLHEAAHAAAVWAQGGTVIDFVWLPSAGHWGYVRYRFPAGPPPSGFAVAIAPYVLWLALAAATSAAGLRRRDFPFRWGSTLFVWGFCVPLADIANAAFPYLRGRENDLRHAFGPPSPVAWGAVVLLTSVACVAAFPLHARFYGENRLSPGAYVALTGLSVAGLLVASGAV